MPRGIPHNFSEDILVLMRKLYLEDRLSLPQIATVLETSYGIFTTHGVINRRLQAMGVSMRNKGRNRPLMVEDETTHTLRKATDDEKKAMNITPLYLPTRTHEYICKQYQAGLTLSNIATRYSSHPPIIRKILRHYNIPLRPSHLGERVSDTRAHQLVQEAIRRGDLKRAPCSHQDPQTGAFCAKGPFNRTKTRVVVVAHHDDYNYPLVVRWLCYKHHRTWHQYNEPIPLTPEMEKELYGNGKINDASEVRQHGDEPS